MIQDGDFAAMGMPELEGMHPDVFPLDQMYEGNLLRDSWMDDGMTWPYFVEIHAYGGLARTSLNDSSSSELFRRSHM